MFRPSHIWDIILWIKYLGYTIYIYILYDMYIASYGIFISYRCLYDDLIQSYPMWVIHAELRMRPSPWLHMADVARSAARPRCGDSTMPARARMDGWCRDMRISRSTLGWVETILWKIDIDPEKNLFLVETNLPNPIWSIWFTGG